MRFPESPPERDVARDAPSEAPRPAAVFGARGVGVHDSVRLMPAPTTQEPSAD